MSETCCTRLTANTVCKKSPFWHHRTTLSGSIFTAKACIDNEKKLIKHRYLRHMSSWYGDLWPTNGRDLLASLGHHCKFQRVLRIGSVTARQSSSGHQPNCGIEQRAPPIFGREAITIGIGPHSSFFVFHNFLIFVLSYNVSYYLSFLLYATCLLCRIVNICDCSKHCVSLFVLCLF